MHLLVTNIPVEYRTPDLRNYFYDFIEKEAFICFHFRHRPTAQFYKELKNKIKTTERENLNGDLKTSVNTTDKHHCYNGGLPSLASIISSSKTSYKNQLHQKRADNVAISSDETSHIGDNACCIIDVKEDFKDSFIALYNNKHWINKEGDVIKSKCIIQEIRNLELFKDTPSVYQTKGDRQKQFGEITTNISNMIELKPPPAMPCGNVGTSIEYFKTQIKSCQLPGILIKKLGLQFKRSKRKRRFGEVPYAYGTRVECGKKGIPNNVVFTSEGHLIPSSYDFDKSQCRSNRLHTGPKMESMEAPAEDGSDVEEWERSEAFYDDVTKQGRCKQRLYEEEIELQWEKGGSGLVFYTDAQFWREQEGDFDERTANEWDVDMSGYYNEGAGDTDARDSMSMLHNTRLKDGTLHNSVFYKDVKQEKTKRLNLKIKGPWASPPKIGKFESHTRGIGRKLMESQGWKEGEGLGKDNAGLPQALDNDGQHPADKSGFGYYGPKLLTDSTAKREKQYNKKRHHDEETVYIGTVFDNPQCSDPPPGPFKRSEPTSISHFGTSSRINFMKSTGD